MTDPSDTSDPTNPSHPSDPTDPPDASDPFVGGFPVPARAPEEPGAGEAPWETTYHDGALPYDVAADGATSRPGASQNRTGTPGSQVSGRRAHPWRLVAAGLIVVGLAVLVGGYFWVQSQADPSGPPGAQVQITVPAGAGESSTGSLLADKGVIGSSLAFRIWTQFNSLPGIQAGAYIFNRNSSFDTVQRVLAAGPNVFPVTVPPGFTVSELAQRIGQLPGHYADRFLHTATAGGVHSPWQPAGVTSLEGLLGTGTYAIVPGETDAQILAKMVDRFDTAATQAGLADGATRLGTTPYQVITVASIVEKEGVLVKNMGPVARVIDNRLANGTALQMDSTVLYALGRDGGPVTTADLRTKSPYNTYLNKGLPPTPTCFPSDAALQAALHPPAGPWLFFVVIQADGTEAFSTTYAGQLANEALAKQRGVG